jgi:arabinogalactan oligomer/maltooligosaccharide transport system substrate-binding protein
MQHTFFFIFLFFFTALLTVSGCTSNQAKTDSKTDTTEDTIKETKGNTKTEIRFWLDGTKEEIEFLKKAVSLFETQNPGLKIIPEFIPFKDLKPRLLGSENSLSRPDIVLITNDWTGELAQKKILAPLKINQKKFLNFTLESVKYKESYFAIPRSFEVLGLIINKDLVPMVPTNFSELKALSQKLKSKNINTLMYDNKNFYYHAPFYFAFNDPDNKQQSSDTEHTNAVNNLFFIQNKSNFSSKKSAQSFRFAKDLVDLGIVPEKCSYSASINMFCSGKAGMIVAGPWALHDIKKSSINFEVTPINIMIFRNKPRPFSGVKALGITSFSAHQKEARKFADFLVSNEIQQETLDKLMFLPSIKSFYFSQKIPNHVKAFFEQTAHSVPMPGGPAMKLIWKELNWGLTQIIDNKSDIEKTLKTVDDQINKHINNQH